MIEAIAMQTLWLFLTTVFVSGSLLVATVAIGSGYLYVVRLVHSIRTGKF